MKKIYLLKGLDCANCASKIEEKLKKMDGIRKVTVDFMNQKLILEFSSDMEENLFSKVKEVIKSLDSDITMEEVMVKEDLKKELLFFIIGLILFIIAILLFYIFPFPKNYLGMLFFILSYFVVGGEVVWKAIRNMLKGNFFDENFLMSVATIGAFIIGEYPEAVAVMLFYQLGELFQKYAINHSRKSIASLMDIRPDYANVERYGKIVQFDPNDVKVGDIIVVRAGEKIPLDGVIVEGTSYLDTTALTGESVFRKVTVGDQVLSGCINQEGILKIKVTCVFQESTVSKILDLVENVSSRKSTSENFITKFSRYYTPIVVGLAILLAFLPPLFLKNTSFSIWIYRALSFLVVSCPCALVISIPLSFFGGIGAAAKSGILVKGSNYLEDLAKMETVVFDKTGTLTQGVFEVQTIEALEISKAELLKLVAYAEHFSSHPISSSIKKAYGKEIKQNQITNSKELPGLGIISQVNGREILAGNEKLMAKNHIKIQKCHDIGTIVYIAIDKKFVGYIVICDKIKENASGVRKQLKQLGIHRLVMLTGDKLEIGKQVAQELGIDTVCAELLPNEKVIKLQELLNQKTFDKKIGYVGDGINDAPVLTLADVGIAMGGVGSDAAIEAADIVIMTDELVKIVDAIVISRKTLKVVKQNISFSIVIKVLVLFFSALGISTMWWAVFADVGVSILAILNALRLLKSKR